MKPYSPVIPGENIEETIYAKDQPPYIPLPVIRGEDGTLLARFHCDWKDRLRLLFFGNVYVWIMTFNEPLQPIQLETGKPGYFTPFKFKDRIKDWFKRSFNFSWKYGWMKTPRGWICWEFDRTIGDSPRVYWSKDQTLTNARVIWR